MLYLEWKANTLALKGEATAGVAAKLRLEDPAEKVGLLAATKYLEGVARTFDLLSVEEFIAFYRRAVDARILQPDFRFAILVVDALSKVVLTIHVSRELMERRLISFEDVEKDPNGVSIALERDVYRWAAKREALA